VTVDGRRWTVDGGVAKLNEMGAPVVYMLSIHFKNRIILMVTTLILLAILAKWPGLLKSEKLKNFIERYTKKKSDDAFAPQTQPGKE